MGKFKKIYTNVRVIILMVFLVLAVVAIHPTTLTEGVAIRSVLPNSTANVAGVVNPQPNANPTSRERITTINNIEILAEKDYYDAIANLEVNDTVTIVTSENIYKMLAQPELKITILNETEEKIITEHVMQNKSINGTWQIVNVTINKTITVNKTLSEVIGVRDLGITVTTPASNNLRKGLDLQGGTRVLLQPEEPLSSENMTIVLDGMKERLNVYGLSDVTVRQANDLSGNQFILVEIAGASNQEVRELLAKQGKFEAKIGSDVVFKGGRDITYVCRSADCSGIDPNFGCGQVGDAWSCRFRFSISLTPDAAERQAALTENLLVVPSDNRDSYLNESLSLYLDDVLVDELRIGADLKGRAVTDIQISGSGVGANDQEATFNSLQNMRRLQTIMITGSLPVKLNVEKSDTISPVLGHEFIRAALLIGALAMLAVAVVSFIRYRKLSVALPMVVTMVSEVVLLLGLAALIGWNLDLAAIAGIIIAVGTGVDHLIVISDEAIRRETEAGLTLKDKIKRAFFIITGAYFTTFVAMLPLMWAGAGLLKGFAVTTIFGITFGVFIARPAFGAVVEILLKE